MFAEATFNFHRLITVDRPEACGNLDTAFTAILNSFHSLYDSIQVQLGTNIVDWYATPELCTILALRNARHHNMANRVRSLFTYHGRHDDGPTTARNYLLIDFEKQEEDARVIEYFISWADIQTLLNLPRNVFRLREASRVLIKKYLNTDAIEHERIKREFHGEHVFLNAVPLIVNAGISILPYIKSHINRKLSTESDAFANHFEIVLPCIPSRHEYSELEIFLPE